MYEVAIIGYGPTGATLANLLAAAGTSVLVIDREPDVYPLPRAVHFDDEVMRVFQTVGVANALATKVRVNPGMKFVDNNGRLLLDWPRPQEISLHGWHASYRLHQPDLERLLRAKLSTQRVACVKTNFNVSSVRNVDECVEIIGTDRESDTLHVYKARYVVGCDGANSLVQRYIGGGVDDLGFEQRWLVVDVMLKHPRPDLGDHSIQYCDATRPMTYCRSPGNRRRWEITVLDHETEAEVTDPDRVWSLLSRWITPDDAQLERQAVYTFHSKLVRRWRKGRLLIAGDAAHLTPPFMGQGMCTGIRDVANLAWKLMSCLQHGINSDLLDTYQAEREPHARAYVKTAMQLGSLINSLDKDNALYLAQDTDSNSNAMKSIAPTLGSSSILCVQNDADVKAIGRPFPQITFQSEQARLDDLVGYRNVVMSRERSSSMSPDICWLNANLYPEVEQQLERLSTNAIWLRPDRYVGALAKSVDSLIDFAPAILKR